METKKRLQIVYVIVGCALLLLCIGWGWRTYKEPKSLTLASQQDHESHHRETRFNITHEWSREFISSPVESFIGRCLTPGVRYQVRPDGDSSRIRKVPIPGDPEGKGVDLDDRPVGYVQYSIIPEHRANSAAFIVEYYRQ